MIPKQFSQSGASAVLSATTSNQVTPLPVVTEGDRRSIRIVNPSTTATLFARLGDSTAVAAAGDMAVRPASERVFGYDQQTHIAFKVDTGTATAYANLGSGQ